MNKVPGQSGRGSRMTNQRRVILEELSRVCSHPTADEIHAMVRKRLPRISLGTVYRNLEVLSDGGFIQKLDVGGPQKLYDAVVDRHYHIRCVRCNRVDDIDIRPMAEFEGLIEKASGYRIVGHRTLFLGVCKGCKEK